MHIYDPATPPDDADRQLRLMLAEAQYNWRMGRRGNLRPYVDETEAIVYYTYLRQRLMHRVNVYLELKETIRALLSLTIPIVSRHQAKNGNGVNDSKVVGYGKKTDVYWLITRDVAHYLQDYHDTVVRWANIVSHNLLYARQEKVTYEAKLLTHNVVNKYLETREVLDQLASTRRYPRYAQWAREQLSKISDTILDMRFIKSDIQTFKKAQQQRRQSLIYEARRIQDWSHPYFQARAGTRSIMVNLLRLYTMAIHSGLDYIHPWRMLRDQVHNLSHGRIPSEIRVLIRSIHMLQTRRISDKHNYQTWYRSSPAPALPGFVRDGWDKHRALYGKDSIL